LIIAILLMAFAVMTPEQTRILVEREYALEQLREMYPMDYYQPNTKSIGIHNDPYDTLVIFGGNRSSKTYSTATDLVMASMGTHTMGYQYRIGTKNKPLRIRVISKPDNIKDNIQPLLKLLFPRDSITWGGKSGADYHRSMRVKAPGWWKRQQFYAYWDFKSIEQDIGTLESVGLDVIWNDEPMPLSFYFACATRIAADCIKPPRLIFSLTPLEGANWMSMEFFEGEQPKSNIGYHVLSIWDNCKCKTPDEHDFKPEPGRMYDKEGYCCCNRGHLHKTAIDVMLDRLKSDPLEYQARVEGKPMFTYRSVFPMFKRKIHVFDPAEMRGWVNKFRPPRGTIYVVVDPHEARPDFMQFWVVDPDGMFYLLDEYPNYFYGKFKGQHYESIRHTPLTPIETAKVIINICQRRIELQVAQCIIDPHFAGKTYNPRDVDKKTVVQVFNEGLYKVDREFPHFSLATVHKDSEGEISAGLKALRELMYVNPNKPIVKGNLPGIQISKWCENSIQALLNHRRDKPSDRDGALPFGVRYEERYKHGVDCARYFIGASPVHILEARYDIDDGSGESPSTWAA